jgi:lysophospholipase L1-like esterase
MEGGNLMKTDVSSLKLVNHHIPLARKQVRYLILRLFWMIVVLVGFEIFMRVYFAGLKPVYVYDPVWGKRAAAGSVVISRTEGSGISHYVADGEIRTPYQGGINVPVYGDSHTESFQVNDDRSYVSLAEKKLRARGIQADLRNFGFSGASLADYAYLAKPAQEKYQPGVIVLQISPEDFWGSEGYAKASVGNYFARNADGTLSVVHRSLVKDTSLIMRALDRFRGFALAGFSLERFRKLAEDYKNSQADTAGAQPAASEPLSDEALQANYRAQLTALHTAYQGQPVILVVLPSAPVLSGGQVVLDDHEYDLLLAQVKQFGDWQVVDPLPAFQNLWLQEHKLPRGFTNSAPGVGHLNADGHVLVGDLLAEKIEEVLQ